MISDDPGVAEDETAAGGGGRGGLAVVVVNFASHDLLRANLTATVDELRGCLVVVVDNPSSESERSAVAKLCHDQSWELVTPTTNGGFGAGMNAGVARARALGAQVFLLLNPDASIRGPDVDQLVARVKAQPLALVAPRILRPDGTLWSEGSDLYLDDGRMRSVRRRTDSDVRRELWLSGACMVLGERLWDLVGGFADDYFLYWEDVELSHRVQEVGGTLEVVAAAVALHAEGGTQGEGHTSAGAAKSEKYYYYNIRNRLLFAARNLSDEDAQAWLKLARPVAKEILLQGGRRQFLRPWRPVRAALRGTRDGKRILRAHLDARRSAPPTTSADD